MKPADKQAQNGKEGEQSLMSFLGNKIKDILSGEIVPPPNHLAP